MEAPGTLGTPPIITRPGSPQACTSTAAIMFDRCISGLVAGVRRLGRSPFRSREKACLNMESQLNSYMTALQRRSRLVSIKKCGRRLSSTMSVLVLARQQQFDLVHGVLIGNETKQDGARHFAGQGAGVLVAA